MVVGGESVGSLPPPPWRKEASGDGVCFSCIGSVFHKKKKVLVSSMLIHFSVSFRRFCTYFISKKMGGRNWVISVRGKVGERGVWGRGLTLMRDGEGNDLTFVFLLVVSKLGLQLVKPQNQIVEHTLGWLHQYNQVFK